MSLSIRFFKNQENACGQERGTFPKHNASAIHQGAREMAAVFFGVFFLLGYAQEEEKIHLRVLIKGIFGQSREEQQIPANQSILDFIISLAKPDIPPTGSQNTENSEDSNSIFFEEWKAEDDPEFANYQEHAPRIAIHLSTVIRADEQKTKFSFSMNVNKSPIDQSTIHLTSIQKSQDLQLLDTHLLSHHQMLGILYKSA